MTQRLTLTPVEGKEGLFEGIQKNGKRYSVRKDRHSYFFPDIWMKLMKSMSQDHQDLFNGLLISGARIEEWLNVRPKDFDWERGNLTLYVTKIKSRKGESRVLGGKGRGFRMSSQYIRQIRAYIKRHNISDEEKIFKVSQQAVYQFLRRKLIEIGVKDYWQYSLHNIRKTCGQWLKTVQTRGKDLDMDEICQRLGHDHNTALRHYLSASIFTDADRDKIVKILGDVYDLR